MPKNKDKILFAALKLFNQDGLVNVRLQHIADEAVVSVGNLAYHFKNKEALLDAIYQALTQQQQALLAEYRIVPLFDNIDRLIQRTFQLQQGYIFFYQDTLELMRAYPTLRQVHRQHIQSQIGQLKVMLDFNVARGALRSEPREGVYETLAAQIWMTMDLWLTQHRIRSAEPPIPEAYRRAVWNLFLPYFTAMGRQEYEQMLQMPYDFYY